MKSSHQSRRSNLPSFAASKSNKKRNLSTVPVNFGNSSTVHINSNNRFIRRIYKRNGNISKNPINNNRIPIGSSRARSNNNNISTPISSRLRSKSSLNNNSVSAPVSSRLRSKSSLNSVKNTNKSMRSKPINGYTNNSSFLFGTTNIAISSKKVAPKNVVPKKKKKISLPPLSFNPAASKPKPLTSTTPANAPPSNYETIDNLHPSLKQNLLSDRYYSIVDDINDNINDNMLDTNHLNDMRHTNYSNDISNTNYSNNMQYTMDYNMVNNNNSIYNNNNNDNNNNNNGNTGFQDNVFVNEFTEYKTNLQFDDDIKILENDKTQDDDAWRNTDCSKNLSTHQRSWGDLRTRSAEVDRMCYALNAVLTNKKKYGTTTNKQLWIDVKSVMNVTRTSGAISTRFKSICDNKNAYAHSVCSKFSVLIDKSKSAGVVTGNLQRMLQYTEKMRRKKEKADAAKIQKQAIKQKRADTLDKLVEIATLDIQNQYKVNNKSGIDASVSKNKIPKELENILKKNEYKKKINDIRDVVDEVRDSPLINDYTEDDYQIIMKCTVNKQKAEFMVDEYKRLLRKADNNVVIIFDALLRFAKLLLI